jgi:mannose-6-phosphate isomerase-like protein (cupin superfamily)
MNKDSFFDKILSRENTYNLWVGRRMRDIKVIKKKESKQFFEGDEQCNLYMKTEKMIFGTSSLEPGKEGTIDPGHKYGEEIFFIAKGTVTCQFSKLSKELQEGDTVIIPIGEPHKLINKSKEPVLVCWALAPPDS